MADDHDAVEFRTRLLHQAAHAVARVAHANGVPEAVTTEAEELLQCQILHRFKVPEDAESIRFMSSYLNEAARNALRRAYRRRQRRVKLRLFSDVDPAEVEKYLEIPKGLEKPRRSYEEIMSLIDEALKSVTPTEMQVFKMARRGCKARIIGKTLGISTGAVHTHLSIVRKKLREIFRRKDSA